MNSADSNRVIGFHIVCPNAGEITQGIAIAFKAGVTKEMFDSTVAIHPTIAEEMVLLNTTTSSPLVESRGCSDGKCG